MPITTHNTSPPDTEIAHTLGLDEENPQSRRKRRMWYALLAVLIVAVGAWITYSVLTKPRDPRFQFGQIRQGELTVRVTATGTLAPVNQVEVGAEISGRIEHVHADFNDRVRRGQMLAELDTDQLTAKVEQSRASLAAAEASVRQADATVLESRQRLQRAEELAAKKMLSQQDMDTARATLTRAEAGAASARAQVTVARAALTADRTNLEKSAIRSPIDGVVISRNIEPGQTVAAAFQTPILFTLAEDLSRMELHVDVDEADVGQVSAGQDASFTVDAYPARRFPAKIVSLRNAPRTVQGVVTYEAILEVDNGELLLRPGMTATAEITTQTLEDVLLIPNGALRFTPPKEYLPPAMVAAPRTTGGRAWIIREGSPVPVRVDIGPTDGNETQVQGGELAAGQDVIVDVTRPED